MKRIVVVSDDLLWGSNALGVLRGAEYDARLIGPTAAMGQLDAEVVIVDLGSQGFDGVAIVEQLRGGGLRGRTPILGVYSHVDVDTRKRAEVVGVFLVIPRSRVVREGAELLKQLLRE